MAGIFLASQPPGMSKICFHRPRHLLGCFGFPLLAIFIAVGNEACLFRNQQSRTALKWRPWFYLRLVAYRSFWLSERA